MLRSRHLARLCFRVGGAPPAAAGALPTSALAAGTTPALPGALAAAHRSFTSATPWDAWGSEPARLQQLYNDLATARNMLPNRSAFTTQFTATGVQLIPADLPPAAPFQEDELDQQTMYADSVKRKRRLKMKKHKHRKRARATRHQNS